MSHANIQNTTIARLQGLPEVGRTRLRVERYVKASAVELLIDWGWKG